MTAGEYAQALQLDPQHAQLQLGLGRALAKQGSDQVLKAASHLREGIRQLGVCAICIHPSMHIFTYLYLFCVGNLGEYVSAYLYESGLVHL